ncbi:MAG: protein translocase subunit SecD [Pseudomonadales bacterium]|nr:protein translocase subunit SecD [Pseudomonadales bacterium]
MMNRYPLWKNLLIVVVFAFGLIYALPNIYPNDPAIQITSDSSSTPVSERILDKANAALDKAGIEHFGEQLINNYGLIRLQKNDDQLRAQSVINAVVSELDSGYVVALNLAETTPAWLKSMGAGPMKLGLDLSGGVHFLLEVDTSAAAQQKLQVFSAEIRQKLREEKLRYRKFQISEDDSLLIRFIQEETRDQAHQLIKKDYDDFLLTDGQQDKYFTLSLRFSELKTKEIEDYAVRQNLTTLRNRVNELGVSEPLVQRQGRNRIVVELPGVQDTAGAKRLLGKTANLEFRLQAHAKTKGGSQRFKFKDDQRGYAELEKNIIVTGQNVSNAQAGFDENGFPQVNINLDSPGGKMMNRITRDNVGRELGVLFIEQKTRLKTQIIDGKKTKVPVRTNQKEIISLATIQAPLGNRFRITGLDSPAESAELALLLRAGALAAPMHFVEERTVGPSLGKQNIELGQRSVAIGLALVLLFMLVYFKMFGLAANIALTFNLILLVAIMSMISATLTLPGIAGIVLTVGMAVDANVLIFARIKEELANRMSPQAAIQAGFERAFVTIFDANITTLLVAVILYAVGTGPVKGFAVTLSIGILTSMFTAIMGTRAIVNLMYGGRKIEKLSI